MEIEFNMEIMILLTGGVEREVFARNSVFRFSFLICQPKTEQKMLAWSKWQKKIVRTTIHSCRRKKQNKKKSKPHASVVKTLTNHWKL